VRLGQEVQALPRKALTARAGTALGAFWRGEVPLADAFWNWAFFGALAVNLSSSAMFLWLLTIDRPLLAAIAGYAYSVPYNILVVVGVWRSADRHPDRVWAEAARIVTLSAMIVLSVT
jgi:hypothetical protein